MRITQGMMKGTSIINQVKKASVLNKNTKKKKTLLQKLMDQKNKVSEQIKNLDKKDLSNTEKSKQLTQLQKQLKALDEAIKLEKQNEEKKKAAEKKANPKIRVAQMKSDALNIMMSDKSKDNRNNFMMSADVKSINQMLAMQKVSMYKNKAVS